MNGINEPEVFKAPLKLPAIVMFKEGCTVDDDPIIMDRFKLLSTFGQSKVDSKAFDQLVKEFVKNNRLK